MIHGKKEVVLLESLLFKKETLFDALVTGGNNHMKASLDERLLNLLEKIAKVVENREYAFDE